MTQDKTDMQEGAGTKAERVAEQTRIRLGLLKNGYTPLEGQPRRRGQPSPYRTYGDVTSVLISRGYETLIDTSDLAAIVPFLWFASVRRTGVYAARNGRKAADEGGVVYLHRSLLRAPPHLVVDHIDGDPLNNTRQNLRLVSQRQNTWNSVPHADNQHKYKGVYPVGGSRRWYAKICVGGTTHRLGSYGCPTAAACAYARAAIHLHGDSFVGLSALSSTGESV